MQTDLMPSQKTWDLMLVQATSLVRSGLLPKSINTPEKAVAIMLKGRELGIPTMEAFTRLYVVNGVVTMAAELMLVLIFKRLPGSKIKYKHRNTKLCEIVASRPDGQTETFSYSIEDARAAGLAHKDNWKAHPRAMLRSRCISEMTRSLFPDAVSGVSYTPEEMGAKVEIDLDDQVESVETEIIEADGPPVEIYEGTPSQIQTVKFCLTGAGINDPKRGTIIVDKIRGKDMALVPEIIEREAKKLLATIDVEYGPAKPQPKPEEKRA